MGASREYPDFPIPGVGAVVLREVEGRTEVLLIRRGSEPMAGGWSLPGGAIELGESIREACVRETREETGLTVEPLADVETIDIIYRDTLGRVQYHYVVVDILCRVMGGELRSGTDASRGGVGRCEAGAGVWGLRIDTARLYSDREGFDHE